MFPAMRRREDHRRYQLLGAAQHKGWQRPGFGRRSKIKIGAHGLQGQLSAAEVKRDLRPMR